MLPPMIATITTYLTSCTREEEAAEQVNRLENRLGLQVPVSWMDDSHKQGQALQYSYLTLLQHCRQTWGIKHLRPSLYLCQ